MARILIDERIVTIGGTDVKALCIFDDSTLDFEIYASLSDFNKLLKTLKKGEDNG